MSIKSEVDRINANIATSYAAIEAKGGTLPSSQDSDNLSDSIATIPAGSRILAITFDKEFLGREYTVSGPNDEIYTGTVSDSLKAFVNVQQGGVQYVVTSTTPEGASFSAKVIVGSAFDTYYVTLQPVRVYGVSWDGTSTTKWTRTDDAAGFTDPVPYVAGATEYGSPFDNIFPWAGMVKEEHDCGTVVAIPKFWYKLEQNTPGVPSSGMTIRIATQATEGFVTSPAHMDRGDGYGERDVVYVGRYHCAGEFKSRSGEKPLVYMSQGRAREQIHFNGETIWQIDFVMRFTIWLLYLVEFADWNSQKTIGRGAGTDGSNIGNTGESDNMPYHTGTMKDSRDTYGYGTQYRNIEGLWENAMDWIDGCYYDSIGLSIILNPQEFGDSNGGINIGAFSSIFPSEFTVSNAAGFPVFYPSKTGGSTSTYSCDNWWYNKNYGSLYGGGAGNVDDAGLFYINSFPSNSSNATISCRVQELPNN